MLRIGADEIIYPERDLAENLAVRYSANNVFDYIQLTPEYSIYEIPVPTSWNGKTIQEVDVRKKHKVNIVAVKGKNALQPMPGADYVFRPEDHIMVIGKPNDVLKLTEKRKH